MDKAKKKEILNDLMTRFPQKRELKSKEGGENLNKTRVLFDKKRRKEKKEKAAKKLKAWKANKASKKDKK